MKAIYKVPSFLAPQVFENWMETPPIPIRTIDILMDKYTIVEETNEEHPDSSLNEQE